MIRRDMFEQEAQFTGSFDQDCQIKSVPQSLLTLVSMIQDGANIKSRAITTTVGPQCSTAFAIQQLSSSAGRKYRHLSQQNQRNPSSNLCRTYSACKDSKA